jgi:hypothetical protein
MKQKLIDQLLHKAGARFGAEGTDYSDFTSSKFAELIINECIDQVAGTKIVDPGAQHAQWNNALVIATMNVRDHFGVKE